MTLQTYLFLCLAALAALPALLLGITQTQRWGAEQTAQSDHEYELAAELLARQTGQLMSMHVREAESLARQVEARGSLDANKLQGMLSAQLATSDGLILMYVADANGIAIAEDPPVDPQGKPAAGTDYSDRDYYQQVVRTGQAAISRVQIGKNSHQPNVQVAAPIWDPDVPNRLLGITEGSVDLGEIQVLADSIAAQHPGLNMVVLDAQGHVLAHPDASLRENMADFSGVTLYQPRASAAQNATDDIRVADDEQGTAYRAVVENIDEQGLGWRVIVGQPEATVQASIQSAQQQTIAVVVAAVVLSLVLAAILAGLIARPIVGLAAAADAVADDDFSKPLPRSRWWHPREVHVQLQAVQRMIQRLRARTDELEQQVAARTAALVETNRELEEAQQRYQSLFAHNPDAVYALDLEGRVVSINLAGEKVTGCPASMMIGHTFRDVLQTDATAEQARRRLEGVLGGEPQSYETTITHRAGHQVALHVTTLPIVVDERIVGAYGIAKDISERKRAERALARSEERFRGLVQNGAELISVVDSDGTVRYASPSADNLLGVTPEKAVGTSLFTFVHPDDHAALQRLLETASSMPSANLTEAFRLRHSDDSWRHVEAVCRNLIDIPEIEGIVLNVRDVTERKVLEAELAYRAYHDALTELPNRALLVDRLSQALARSVRNEHPTGVMFIDLDDFKVVNDSLGHRLGDQLLVSVAQRLRTCVRPGDTVARLGGDEFIVLLEDLVDAADASGVAERVLTQLQTAFHLDGRDVFVGASIGMALSGSESVLPDDLLRDADIAMYAAKARGKGHWELFQAGMQAHPMERLELEADLRRALERGELRLHYQPIVDLEDRQICGVEALLRWQHAERGLVSPMEFIPLAEETGLIVPIGRWVLNEACRQARVWTDRNPSRPPLTMSVNISGRQFQHPSLVEDVKAALRDAALPPAQLRLEITESVAMEAGVATIQTLQALKGLGVQLAIDDFGTGYSSLAYLKRFPVDVLKIDRSFVDGLGHDVQDTAIVRSVITIAKSLDLAVTGEGVETAEQLSQLRALDCDEGQGYYFARPQPSEAVGQLIERDLGDTDKDLQPAA